ncbi:hypothetical protein [Corynebacterium sp.]|uniref:hypothetical protein n=1 Tax=Corynebacterium sp. TaxID=1720 RepID=UPI0026DD6074|nr:hypothetical protein [Corynebacterium sp.]MDO5076773.1 hypothetical protein [Corynebacterium sp.]
MGPDSLLHRVLDKFSDVAVVSAVTVLCCAFVIPGGRAVRASTHVWLTDPPRPIAAFFRGLCEPGGALTWWWFLMVAAHLLAVVEWLAVDNVVVRAGLLSGVLLVNALSVWIVPVAALRGLSLPGAFRESMVLFVSQLPRTLGALAVVALTAGALLALLPHSLFFGFLGIGVAQYCVTLLVSPPLGCSNNVA